MGEGDPTIKLHVATWHLKPRFSLAASDDVKEERFRQILRNFITMAVKNNLGEHPANEILQKCYETANFKGPIEVVELRRRIQWEDKPTLVSSPPEQKYCDLTFTK